MAKREVELRADEGIFLGLAKQNMLFHQCIGELVDNSIAQKKPDEKFRIYIILHKIDNNTIRVFIADNGNGMSATILGDALQLGKSPTTNSRLHEHGFGLKNALATLSSGTGFWKIYTKDFTSGKVGSVSSPFNSKMTIDDDDSFPTDIFLPTDYSTLIEVDVKMTFLQTVQGRGAKATDLLRIREWLIEHLGVFYRGYLEQSEDGNYENEGTISVAIDNDSVKVPPIPVPFGHVKTDYFDIELNGQIYSITYKHGTLDPVRRDKLVRGSEAKYYYQGNSKTQGIDIRLDKRVIAVHQLETIWKTEEKNNKVKQLSRHPGFNDFVGELIIPSVPRGVLTTVNNKTDFNLDDQDWQSIFEVLNSKEEYKPIRDAREKTESLLRDKWVGMLKATNPEDTASTERSVWGTGVKIDVYRKTKNGEIIIYEVKVGAGAPLNLYQLKMYWDGLCLSGEYPKEAVLLVESFSTVLEEMANTMNTKLKPPEGSNSYNLRIERHADKNL